jgi:hypothetical protein
MRPSAYEFRRKPLLLSTPVNLDNATSSTTEEANSLLASTGDTAHSARAMAKWWAAAPTPSSWRTAPTP